MNLCEKLIKSVKPELNHIYTEKRFEVSGGKDMGWFCREHAFHLYLLALSLGFEAQICLGDFFVHSTSKRTFTSVGDSDDHAWCEIAGEVPVDISISFAYFPPDVENIPIVFGQNRGVEQPWKTVYFANERDDDFRKTVQGKAGIIAYNEAERLSIPPLELLSDPFQFLLSPPRGCPKFTEIHGEDVFWQITYHCYKLVKGEARPLYTYRDPRQTVRGIVKYNPDAKEQLCKVFDATT